MNRKCRGFMPIMACILHRVLTSRDDYVDPVGMKGRLSVGIGLALFCSSSAWAAQTNLGSVGQTQLQQDTGDAVQLTCAGFVAAGTRPGTVPLFDTCRAMVQTGNEVTDNGGPTSDSLGLNADELAASLQQIATEEFANTESMATEMSSNRFNSFLTRLFEVRRGVRGFSVSGFGFDGDRALAGDPAGPESGVGGQGGAAGDDADWGKLGMYLNGSYGTGDRDETRRTDKFDFDTYSVTFGADYRFTDSFVLGAAVNYYDVSTDFDKTATVAGGNVDADGWGGFVYATYYGANYYVDGLVGYAKSDYDVRRRIFIPSKNPDIDPISETAKGSPDSDDYTLSLGAGYDFNRGALTFGPYGRFTYLKVDMDDYTEHGAEASGLDLKVQGQDWTSMTSTLGMQFSYANTRSFGVLMPQAQFGWVHEFKNDSEDITATYVEDPRNNMLRARTDNPDRDYFQLGIGISSVFKGGAQVFFNYDTILGLSDLTDHMFTVGGRMEF